MPDIAKRYEGIKPRHLWVDVEMLHWVAHPDPEMRGRKGSFTLDCLKLYLALCAEAMRQAIRPKATSLFVAQDSDLTLLKSVGLGDAKSVVSLGVLKRLGLVRRAYAERKYDISYTPNATPLKNDTGESEEEAHSYTIWRMYQKYEQRYGDTAPEDFMERLWAVHRCDGQPKTHNNPSTGVKAYVQLDWSLFQRDGGRNTNEFMSLSAEEVFLLILLHQGTRPFLTCGIHPNYVSRDKRGGLAIGDVVAEMCDAAGFHTPIEEILSSLVAKGYFAWVSVPLASQDAGLGSGGSAERTSTYTVVGKYDARHPSNLMHPKKERDSRGNIGEIPQDELLERMTKTVLAPTRGFYVHEREPIWAVLESGDIEVRAAEDSAVGQLMFGRFPIPAEIVGDRRE